MHLEVAKMRSTIRVLLALLPLFSTPVLGFLLAGGYLNLGGGGKEIILVLPWMFCSLVYGISCFFLWHRRWPFGRSILFSIILAIAGLVLAGVALAGIGQLGVGGRF